MAIAALEPLVVPTDGTQASSAAFGKPTSDLLKGFCGAAAGQPDANNGNPIFARTFATGLLGFTNALGITTNPGASPSSVFSTSSAQSITVPTGQQLIVVQLVSDGSPTLGAAATINDGTNTTTIAQFRSGQVAQGPVPYVLDQQFILTTPQHTGWVGYYVLRDTAVLPFARQVTSTTTYTVPAGKTLWLFGCVGINAASSYLQTAGGAQYVCFAAQDGNTPAGNTGLGNGNGLQSPVPFAAGTVLQSSTAQACCLWGVLI